MFYPYNLCPRDRLFEIQTTHKLYIYDTIDTDTDTDINSTNTDTGTNINSINTDTGTDINSSNTDTGTNHRQPSPTT